MTPCDKILISAEKLTQGRLICHMKPKTEKSGKSETKKRICSEILVTVRESMEHVLKTKKEDKVAKDLQKRRKF